jgi:hypothetical protein
MARGDTVDQVREIAASHEVSERTVWRWFATMRDTNDHDLELLRRPRACAYCGRPLPEKATLGRRFCTNACRQANDRRRRARNARPG